MQMPSSWDDLIRRIVAKNQQTPRYCIECGREIELMRVMHAGDEVVRRRQLAMQLCWQCAGGES